MATGLRVWDASGNLIFDTPDRAGRIIGFATISAGSGSIAISLPSGVRPFFVVTSFPSNIYNPQLTISSMTTSAINYTANATFQIMYGYY